MKCTNCGQVFDGDAAFCPNCGTPFSSESGKGPTPPLTETPLEGSEPQPSQQPQQAEPTDDSSPYTAGGNLVDGQSAPSPGQPPSSGQSSPTEPSQPTGQTPSNGQTSPLGHVPSAEQPSPAGQAPSAEQPSPAGQAPSAEQPSSAGQAPSMEQQQALGSPPSFQPGQQAQAVPPQSPPTQPKKPMNKAIIWIAASVIVLIGVGFGLFKYGETLAAPANVVDEFEAAVKSKDAKALVGILESGDEKLKLSEKSLANFIKFLQKDKDAFDELLEHLQRQANHFDPKKDDFPAEEENEHASINLKKSGKKWGVYDDYQLIVTPASLNVSSNLDNSDIFVNGKKAGKIKSRDKTLTVGPLLPGSYEIKAVVDGKLAKTEAKEKVTLFQMDRAKEEAKLSFDADFVTLRSEYADAEVYVNGKETDMTVKDAVDVGPLPLDGTIAISIKKDYPWGTIESEPIKIEETFVDIDFYPISEKESNELMDFMNTHMKERFAALEKRDASKLTGVTKNYVQDIEKEIKKMKSDKKRFSGVFKRIGYDVKSIVHPIWNDSKNRYEIHAKLVYDSKEDEYNEGEKPKLSERPFISRTLILLYDEKEKEWVIDHIQSDIHIQTDRDFEF
ncbi:TcaA 3rd/4th domain-containing protein [Numidum massiliense]|uniref:TcaA 3rd/4th domain-containing protein n=1 Tax=Numidum massiliense TaxID=1522315 RepID=UPI0006D57FB2|nr:hypothetical protein [Numidum massiliense]